MKTSIQLTGRPNTLTEPDGRIRVDREIELISDSENGIRVFFLGEGTRVNFPILLNTHDALALARELHGHVCAVGGEA